MRQGKQWVRIPDGSEELERLMDPVGGVVVPELPSGPGKGKIVSMLIRRKR